MIFLVVLIILFQLKAWKLASLVDYMKTYGQG